MSVHLKQRLWGPERPKSVDPSLYARQNQHPSSGLFSSSRSRSGSNSQTHSASSTPPQVQTKWMPRSMTPAPVSSASASHSSHGRARSGTGSSTASASFLSSSLSRGGPPGTGSSGVATDTEGPPPAQRHRKSMSHGAGMGVGTSPILRPGTATGDRSAKSSRERDGSTSSGNSNGGDDDWKNRIHQEQVQRYHTLKKEAEAEFQAKLRVAASSSRNGFRERRSSRAGELERKLVSEHEDNLAELARMMEEEEKVMMKDEKKRRRLSRSQGQVQRMVFLDDEDADEILWKPDQHERGHSRRGSREDRISEAVRMEQQVILAAIQRSNPSPPERKSSIGSGGSPAANANAMHDSRKVHWSQTYPRPSTPSQRPMSPAISSSLGAGAGVRPSTAEPTLHERWMPSVHDYAADMRERERDKPAATHSSASSHTAPRPIPGRAGHGHHHSHTYSGAMVDGETGSGGGGSFGSWRDWRMPGMAGSAHSSNSSSGAGANANANVNASAAVEARATAGARRAFTPAPGPVTRHASNAPAPPVPAVPHARTRTVSLTQASAPPPPMPSVVTSTTAAEPAAPPPPAKTPAPTSAPRREIVDDREDAPEEIVRPSSRWKGKGKAVAAPIDFGARGTARGMCQQQLEDMASRLRREFAITT